MKCVKRTPGIGSKTKGIKMAARTRLWRNLKPMAHLEVFTFLRKVFVKFYCFCEVKWSQKWITDVFVDILKVAMLICIAQLSLSLSLKFE